MKIQLAMNNIRTKISVLVLLISISIPNFVYSQVNTNQVNSDSLILADVIKATLDNYPTIKSAEENLNATDYKIDLAKTSYLPDVDFTTNYSRIGPAPTMDFGGHTFQLSPENNYSSYINLRQNIYDFGRTSKSVSAENVGKEASQHSLGIIKQKLSVVVISNFYSLLYLQNALKIKQQQLDLLNEHLNFIIKKKETGSAIDYEILSTQVKISSVESQKLDILAALNIQEAQLNTFMGRSTNEPCLVKDKLEVLLPEINTDSIINYAYNHREEMAIAQVKNKLAGIKYDLVSVQNRPNLNLFASGGIKNGYPDQDLDKPKLNFVAGVSFRVPIFDANRTKYNKNIAKSEIQTTSFEVDNLKRTISNEVVESKTNLEVSSKKISQFILLLKQSIKAYELAKVKFKEGTITNLDLLDATNSISESQLLLLKSRIDYTVNIYRVKAAIGDKLY